MMMNIGMLMILYSNKRMHSKTLNYTNKKKAPTTYCNRGFNEKRQLPTLPHCIAVPSAQLGLTSLFEMGRGGTPTQ